MTHLVKPLIRWIRRRQKSGANHAERGDAARDIRDWPRAAKAYRQHLKQRPDDFSVTVQLGHMLKESGDVTGAAAAYETAAVLKPDDADLLLQRGHLAKQQGDLALAARLYRDSHAQGQEEHAAAALSEPAIAAHTWLHRYGSLSRRALDQIRDRAAQKTLGMTLSIILPVYNTPNAWLNQAIDSVLAQHSPDWRLVCVDDCSAHPDIARSLAAYAASDDRITVLHHTDNQGIAAATNTGLRAAQSPYVVLMDHDDWLEPEAVGTLLQATKTNADLIYTDEIITGDEINDLRHFSARPAFSRDYYLSHPYFVHALCIRRSLALEIGGFDETMAISADVDFVLRLIASAKSIAHIRAFLYRWRTHAQSAGHLSKTRVTAATLAALNRHLALTSKRAVAVEGPRHNFHHVTYSDDNEKTLTILLAADDETLTTASLKTLLDTTDADIVLVGAEPSGTASFSHDHERVRRHFSCPNSSKSAVLNQAAASFAAPYRYLVFLNAGLTSQDVTWLNRLRSLASRPDVGIVSPVLVSDLDRVIQAGVMIDPTAKPVFAHRGMALRTDAERSAGDNGGLIATRDYSALASGCAVLRAEVFTAAGGFDETYEAELNTIDLCLRLTAMGLRVLNDGATVLHCRALEADETSDVGNGDDLARFQRKWAGNFDDPFYIPVLSDTCPGHGGAPDAVSVQIFQADRTPAYSTMAIGE